MRGDQYKGKVWTTPPTPEELEELTRDYTDDELAEINATIRAEKAKLSPEQRKAIKDNAQYYERIEGENLYIDGE